MTKVVILLLVLAFSLNGEMITRTKVLMGTFATLKLQEEDKHHLKAVYTLLERVDKSLSSYDKTSPIYKLNRDRKAYINLYTYEALTLSKQYYKETAGYFDIAIGSITKDLYHFGEEERVPQQWELNASDTSFTSLKFDKHSAMIGQGIKIDLGGMGKGFGVDRAVELLLINGVTSGSVALSGDIRCLDICKIDVHNPFDRKPLVSFYTNGKNIGISTSGNYHRYVETRDNNHLINPKTKQSETNFISITLISTVSNSDLDAYATAASVMPKELAYKFLDGMNLAYVVLESDRSLHMSENIAEFTSLKNNTLKENPQDIQN